MAKRTQNNGLFLHRSSSFRRAKVHSSNNICFRSLSYIQLFISSNNIQFSFLQRPGISRKHTLLLFSDDDTPVHNSVSATTHAKSEPCYIAFFALSMVGLDLLFNTVVFFFFYLCIICFGELLFCLSCCLFFFFSFVKMEKTQELYIIPPFSSPIYISSLSFIIVLHSQWRTVIFLLLLSHLLYHHHLFVVVVVYVVFIFFWMNDI